MPREQRGAERVAVSIPGEFFVLRERRECEIRTLSTSGISFRASVRHLNDARAHVRFVVPETEKPIAIDGVLVRRRRVGLESEWALRLDRSNEERNQIYDEFVARTAAGETRASQSPNRPLPLRDDDKPALESLYREALDRLGES